MVSMSVQDQTLYPRLKDFLRIELPKVVNDKKKWSAFLKYSEFQGRWFGAFLAGWAIGWDSKPTIKIKPLPDAWGEYLPGRGEDIIYIDKSWATRFERDYKLAKAKIFMEALILHEMVHWGDDQDGKDQPGEEGEAFEKAAYGTPPKKYW